MIVGGKETTDYGKSHCFISVHHIEKEFPLLGTKSELVKFLRKNEQALIDGDNENNFLFSIQSQIQKKKDDLKFGYKVFHSYDECIYNIEFFKTKRRYFAGSDMKFFLFLGEVCEDNTISILKHYSFHTGRIFNFKNIF